MIPRTNSRIVWWPLLLLNPIHVRQNMQDPSEVIGVHRVAALRENGVPLHLGLVALVFVSAYCYYGHGVEGHDDRWVRTRRVNNTREQHQSRSCA